MAPPNFKDYVTDAEGRTQLRQMIHHERHGSEQLLVPPRIRREVALEVLDLEVTPSLKGEEPQRAGDVARFYVLSQVTKNFAAMLQRGEHGIMDVVRSIECLRVMGDLGTDEQQAQAADYFDYLLANPLFEKTVPQFIECYFHLPAGANEKNLAARLQRLLQAARPAGSASAEPSNQAIMLEDYLQGDLPVTQHAKELRHKILGEKDNQKRATLLARLYLGVDAPGGVDWVKWSAFEIMREVLQTSEINAVAGLRTALAAVAPQESREFQERARGRALKAMLFLKGELDQQQKLWMEEDKTQRFQLEG
jgi:hypothetical protein